MSRTESLNRTLANLQASSTDIEAAAVVSVDGLIIASSLPPGVEEAQVAAMSAAILAMGTRTAMELKRGSIEQLFVKGNNGYVVVMNAGPHAVLLALTRKDSKLGLIFLECSRSADEVKKVLG